MQKTISSSLHSFAGQVVLQALGDSIDGISRSTSPVGNGPCLVQVVVNGIHAESSQVDVTCNGIHVGSVHVNESASFVNLVGD